MESVSKAEKTKYHKPTEMFFDVYDKPSALLEKQQKEFLEHLKTNSQHYPLNNYEKI
jgi:hypothetical protein